MYKAKIIKPHIQLKYSDIYFVTQKSVQKYGFLFCKKHYKPGNNCVECLEKAPIGRHGHSSWKHDAVCNKCRKQPNQCYCPTHCSQGPIETLYSNEIF